MCSVNSKPARLRDVAERAGVSVATVSSYLNTPWLVSERSKAKVEQAIAELRFVPNAAARQLRSGSSRMIAFIAFDVSDPLFTSVARGARERAAESNLRLVLADTDGQPETEQGYLTLFEEQRVRGLLLAPAGDSTSYLEQLATSHLPTVLIDQVDPAMRMSSVSVNDILGGEIAVRHLLELGRRTIVVVGGDDSIRQVADRREGARRAVAAVDGASVRFIDSVERNVAAGRAAGTEIVDGTTLPDAIFCINDLLAAGALQTFGERGIRVPEDIAVIGFNDVVADAGSLTSLSSVRQPHEAFGTIAMELLLEQLEGKPPRQVVFDPELVVRSSTAG